jgi:hypothetical protein
MSPSLMNLFVQPFLEKMNPLNASMTTVGDQSSTCSLKAKQMVFSGF